MPKNEQPAGATVPDTQYSKQQLVGSKKYAHRRDLIGALLVDGKLYKTDDVDALIKEYDGKKV